MADQQFGSVLQLSTWQPTGAPDWMRAGEAAVWDVVEVQPARIRAPRMMPTSVTESSDLSILLTSPDGWSAKALRPFRRRCGAYVALVRIAGSLCHAHGTLLSRATFNRSKPSAIGVAEEKLGLQELTVPRLGLFGEDKTK